MTITEERLENIRANAELVARELSHATGEKVSFDQDSVGRVETFIESQRAEAPDTARQLVNVLGCYLGEAVIEAVPGALWGEDKESGALCVVFPNGDMAFPFYKVAKQIDEGLENGESILSFYNISVKYVAAGKLGEASSGETP